MYIIIIGCGKLGSILAKELSIAGHHISIIDHDSEKLNVLGSGFNGTKIKSVEYDNDHLTEAGISRADFVVAVTSDDNINITVSLIAKKIYNVPRIIARVADPNRKYIYDMLGIETICPTRLGVEILKKRITAKSLDVIATLGKNHEVIELTVLKGKILTINEIEEKYSCIISGLIIEGKFSLPKKNELVPFGSKIICTINNKYKEKLMSSFSKEIQK